MSLQEAETYSETYIEDLILDIVEKNPEFQLTDEFEMSLEQIFQPEYIDDFKWELRELIHGSKLYIVRYKSIRISNKWWNWGEFHFMLHGGWIIPLGTHIDTDAEAFVYDMKGKRLPLSDYIASNLPESVTLSRVLSPAEVEVFSMGDYTKLGSSHQLFWNNKVHLSFGDPTPEFKDKEGYSRCIKFIFSKQELSILLSTGVVKIGTYKKVFGQKSEGDIFPFDFECVFSSDSYVSLVQAYYRWKVIEGVESIPSPYYSEHTEG